MIALAVLMLIERGLIALGPMARHWPYFRADTTVRQVLSHTSGLATFEVPRPAEAWADWDLLCADLAAAEPEWPPARFVAEEIAGPYGLDFGFGLGPAAIARCTDLEYDAPDWPVCNTGEPGSVRARAVANPAGARDLAVLNSDLWRTATVPAVNLHATAMLIARFYRVLLDGDLPSPAIAPFEGVDRFIGSNTVWGLGVRFEPDGTWGMGGLGGNAGRPYTGRRSRT